MKIFLRIAVVTLLGVASFLTSSFLVARGTSAPTQGKESLHALTAAEAAVARRGVPAPARLAVRDLTVLLDRQTLGIAGVGLLDNHGAPSQRLTWSVRIVDPSKPEQNLRDREVLYEKRYDRQEFVLVQGASVQPTFEDILTLHTPLPPGRYGIELALVNDVGEVVTRAGKYVEVE